MTRSPRQSPPPSAACRPRPPCTSTGGRARYACPGPVLDVGCGDGLFARMAFDQAEVWGIDIDAAEGRWAAASQAYTQVILGDVTRATLPEAFFATCVANCSLEHVPRIDLALRTIHDALRPGGLADLFVPNAEWASHLKSARVLRELGAPALGSYLERSIDQLFRHHHLYDARGWGELVARAGFELVAVEPVMVRRHGFRSRRASRPSPRQATDGEASKARKNCGSDCDRDVSALGRTATARGSRARTTRRDTPSPLPPGAHLW